MNIGSLGSDSDIQRIPAEEGSVGRQHPGMGGEALHPTDVFSDKTHYPLYLHCSQPNKKGLWTIVITWIVT